MILEQKDPAIRLRLLSFACYSLVSLMKYWALTVRKPKIKRCIEQMYADWKQVSRCSYIRGTTSGKVTRTVATVGTLLIHLLKNKITYKNSHPNC